MSRSLYPHRRQRRLRTRPSVRDMVRENVLTPKDFIQPLFVKDQSGPDDPIPSMPGQFRHSLDSLVARARRAWDAGVPAVALFPKVSDSLKTEGGEAAWDPQGIVPEAIAALKAAIPDLLIITDVALDPYSSLGQDGVVVDGEIHNDRTIDALVQQALCQAQAGADLVAPSDMMDGRIGAIRDVLDENDCDSTLIFAYSAKYASAFYGPFRDALDSAPRAGTDKRTYQMDPGNGDEAIS